MTGASRGLMGGQRRGLRGKATSPHGNVHPSGTRRNRPRQDKQPRQRDCKKFSPCAPPAGRGDRKAKCPNGLHSGILRCSYLLDGCPAAMRRACASKLEVLAFSSGPVNTDHPPRAVWPPPQPVDECHSWVIGSGWRLRSRRPLLPWLRWQKQPLNLDFRVEGHVLRLCFDLLCMFSAPSWHSTALP